MGRRDGPGRQGRPGTGGRRRAPDHGRRAHLRGRERPRRAGMEHRRPGPDQARPGQRAGAQAARRIRPGRLPALRPGQVVPRRAAAALGPVDLLARRRPADLARPQPVCRRARAACVHRGGFAALHPDAVAQARPVRPLHRTRLRGHLVLPVARAPPAGQRGPVRIETGRRDGAHPPAPRLHPGAGHRRRLRAAAAVQPARRPRPGRSAVDHRAVVLP